MSERIELPFGLEIDITHACNLHCPGCAHYSDYGFAKHVPFAEAAEWMIAASKRLRPQQFSLLGGEPSLHPEAASYVVLAARLWPDVPRAFISNGLLLYRQDILLEALAETRTHVEVSFHSPLDQDYVGKFRKAAELLREKADHYNLSITIRDTQYLFYKNYRGEGPGMRPFNDGEPEESWKHCVSKACLTIHQGRLWKCPPIAFLRMALQKHGIEQEPEWQPYLGYAGIGLDVSDQELFQFLERNYLPETICGMCPKKIEYRALEDVTTFRTYK